MVFFSQAKNANGKDPAVGGPHYFMAYNAEKLPRAQCTVGHKYRRCRGGKEKQMIRKFGVKKKSPRLNRVFLDHFSGSPFSQMLFSGACSGSARGFHGSGAL